MEARSNRQHLASRLRERLSESAMLDLAQRLIAIPSENPPGNQYEDCARILLEELTRLGFDDVRSAHMAIFQHLGPEGARIGELAERAKLTNQSVGYLVDYLEEHGYVERRPDPTNRRATLVCFTERGWDEADACAKILDQLDEELMNRMGTQRLEQLQALLAEATAALQASKQTL